MGKILGDSIRQEAQILKEIKDGTIEDISITTDGMVQVDGSNTNPKILLIPLEKLGIKDINQLTIKELKQRIFNLLCRETLREMGTIHERKKRNGDTSLYVEFEPGEFMSMVEIETSRISTDGRLSKVIDIMAEKIDPFPHTESGYFASSDTDLKVDDFLYSACVTKMKFEQEDKVGIFNVEALLSAIYNIDYGEWREHNGHEVVTSNGQARDIAHRLKAYGRTSGHDKTFPFGMSMEEAFATMAIDGINIVNALYCRMVELGYIEPYSEPRSTQDRYELVYDNIDMFLEKIIEEAKEIHDTLTPKEIKKLTRKGIVFDPAEWMDSTRSDMGKEGFVNPRVSLAISNHYLDGVFMQYGIDTEEQEKNIAISQRVSRLLDTDEISNIELYAENLRKLQSRMITGLTLETEGNLEIDGEMYATTNIGTVRENQEDAVLLLKDDDVPGLKMMIVSDGMGGADKGEVASHIVVTRIKEWFEGLSKEQKVHYYSNIGDIESELNRVVREASDEIDRELFIKGGATLVCSVIGKDETIISNVGDSRAYIVADGKLDQVSVDDATVQEMYEMGKIPSKEAARFHRRSNEITASVGGMVEDMHSSVLSNDDYDMILLFSDGVTDCLSEDEIAVITRTTDRSKLSQKLVRRALYNVSRAPEEVSHMPGYVTEIRGGKDNTTAAVYIKDEESKDER